MATFTKEDVMAELRYLMRVVDNGTPDVPKHARVSYLRVQAVNFREAGDDAALAAVRNAEGALARGDEQAAYECIRDEVIRREELGQ